MINGKFKVSVGIPVYNGEKFIKKSAESAVNLKEVAEVIIVDDGSTDNTHQICRELEKKNKKVNLYQHPGAINRGLGASRNLAIKKSDYEYIAFLDADDYYLPNRFTTTKKVFEQHPDADGVYEALGTHFYSEKAKETFLQTFPYFKNQDTENVLTTFQKRFKPEDLFNALVLKSYGELHNNTLTLKKSLFKKAGYLKENMILHGDNEAFLRFSYYGRLYPGELNKAVAVRGVHSENRVTKDQDSNKRHIFNEEKYLSFCRQKLNRRQARIFLKDYVFGHKKRSRKNVLAKYGSLLMVIFLVFKKDSAGFLNILYYGYLKPDK